VTNADYYATNVNLYQKNKDKIHALRVDFFVCNNQECNRPILHVRAYDRISDNHKQVFDLQQEWQLLPESLAKPFDNKIIPKVILDDYHEACLILNKSPKASATLARRCLQGIIRDFWSIQKSRLKDEIDELKNQQGMDSDLWEAIDGIRKLGNIGAHMEKDVNLIQPDIEPEEAEKLIGLLEILFEEWYIARHKRREHVKSVKEIAIQKKPQNQAPTQ
jgi:hypothetical protein